MRGRDIRAFARKGFADIAQQAGAVLRFDLDIDGEQAVLRRTPARFDHALGAFLHQVVKVRAADAMDRYTLAACDKAADRIRRCGLAAARQLGHQAVDPDDQYPLARRCRDPAFPGRQLGFGRGRLDGFEQGADVAQAPFAPRRGGVQVVGSGKSELARELLQVLAGAANPLQLALDQGAAGGMRFLEFLSQEILPHLGARAMAGEKTQGRIEPVPRRTADLGGDDFDPLPGAKHRVERDQRTIDPRASAAMADIAVQVIGEVDRR